MKRNRVWMGAVTAALALTVLTTGALAGWHHGRSGGGNGGTGACAGTACGYVDANGACHYVDADGDGVCDNYGQYAGTGNGGGHHGGGCRGGGCHR